MQLYHHTYALNGLMLDLMVISFSCSGLGNVQAVADLDGRDRKGIQHTPFRSFRLIYHIRLTIVHRSTSSNFHFFPFPFFPPSPSPRPSGLGALSSTEAENSCDRLAIGEVCGKSSSSFDKYSLVLLLYSYSSGLTIETGKGGHTASSFLSPTADLPKSFT